MQAAGAGTAKPVILAASQSRIADNAIRLDAVEIRTVKVAATQSALREQHVQYVTWLAQQKRIQQAKLLATQQAAQQAAQQQQQQAPPASSGTTHITGVSAFEACVIQRESGGNPRAYNSSSGASGLFGMLLSTWDSLGLGYSGGAYTAPVSVQEQGFNILYARDGTSPWAPYDGC